MSQAVQVAPARFVTIGLASIVTGLTAKAINDKIDKGHWAEGREWTKGPDGRRYVDLRGYEKWVEKEAARSRSVKRASD